MIYAILFVGSIGGVMSPAVQGLISRSVGADEQGSVQGSLSSLVSIAGIIGPPIATGLFAYFISEKPPWKIPGAAFFCSALLVLLALTLAVRSFRKNGAASKERPVASITAAP